MRRLSNPFSFTPVPVTIITSVIYIVLIASLLVIHHVLPQPKEIEGVSVDEAWHDLQVLSSAFHPYNSRKNDEVRNWLLDRINEIVPRKQSSTASGTPTLLSQPDLLPRSKPSEHVVVFNDLYSNLSSSINASALRPAICTYFESTNIIIYIRGSEDDPTDWWRTNTSPSGEGGVLVNAHYDSVSTGYGATDDGVGVVTILQLIKYFSNPAHQPKKGIVALLNSGEEDFLNGARVFFKNPISSFPRTFLNLEGAGAGGRAILFRSTNAEVTKSYQKSRHPMGNVISADGFKRGLIRSETDYSIFYPQGMQGLDVAFFEPRARYHTNQDDTKHTSKASVYHMLSASLETMKGLTEADEGDRGEGTDGVWFDMFGSALAVFRLKTLYALSVTLLVVAPITLAATGALLYRSDRQYILSGSTKAKGAEDGEPVSIKGIRGVFRWPIAFILATAAVILLGLLVSKLNPYILYSSPYAVWAMYISAFIPIFWASVTTADYFRPTAFQRLYTILWLSLAAWALLILGTLYEVKAQLGGAYLLFFYHASIFLATTLTLLELFGLPKKQSYASELLSSQQQPPSRAPIPDSGSVSSAQLIGPTADEIAHTENQDEDVDSETDERTSLLQGTRGATTFKHYHSPSSRTRAHPSSKPPPPPRRVYHLEQAWSHSLPTYLWLLSFLLIAPIPIILITQTSLLLTSAISQTLADGATPILPYISIAILSILLLAPLGPYLHRYTYQIPLFLVLVCVGTLLYNILAFPFSANNRLKVAFVQRVDLDDGGANTVTVTGVSQGHYLRSIIDALPSTYEQSISCGAGPLAGLHSCNYTGLAPNLSPPLSASHTPTPLYSTNTSNATNPYTHLFNLSLQPLRNRTNTARFHLTTTPQTRNCVLRFHKPVTHYSILDSNSRSSRFPATPPEGTSELRLWTRTWGGGWKGEITWKTPDDDDEAAGIAAPAVSIGNYGDYEEAKGEIKTELRRRRRRRGEGISGRVACMYADANTEGTIPALDEIWAFAPAWAAVTKAGDGLVEVGREWEI